MVAKASTEGRGSPIKIRQTSLRKDSEDVYQPWEMTDRERELTTKCVKLIQGRIPSKVNALFIYSQANTPYTANNDKRYFIHKIIAFAFSSY